VSYAFDVSWLNVLYILCAGGCLCVPSHHEIQNEPREAIARRQANTAFITPTVGKLLHGADLKIINYGGENLPRDEINYWKDRAKIIHSYGPSECTPIAISHTLGPERSTVIIGKAALGARSWIVEPSHGKSLAAVGDVGELWIEGPIVGQGYLNDPERTAVAFVENPEWLTSFHGFSGHHDRMYRTGDLVRYEEDGNLQFIGRKDAQIKIRGQRVELEEIEQLIHDAVAHMTVSQVVVDIVELADAGPVLVAFIELSDKTVVVGSPEAKLYAQQLAVSIKPRLSASIPRYMIPNAYMVVESIPNTTSGKVDRGKLRKSASSMTKSDLLQAESVKRRPPVTPEEMKLHALVAQVLSWDRESFGMDNNFIQLGGDSISAMRLASLARNAGVFLTVTDILTKDRIADLLLAAQQARPEEASEYRRFVLLDVADAQKFVEEVVMTQIEPAYGGQLIDVLPTTDMQSTYLRNNLHSPRRSWLYSYIDFAQAPEESRLVHSLEKLVEVCEIYRTAFVRSGDAFFQAVFDSWKPTIDIVDDVEYVESAFSGLVAADVKAPASLGAPLVQFKLIRGQNGTSKLVFGMSHATYDAISVDQTLQILADIYNGVTPKRAIKGYHRYLHHIHSSKETSYTYWRKTLQNSSLTIIPCTSSAPR
jgi:aryl carrier-like protein